MTVELAGAHMLQPLTLSPWQASLHRGKADASLTPSCRK